MLECRATLRQYLPLALVAILLLGLVAGWSRYEHTQARVQAEGELRRTARMVSAALQGSVSSQVRRGCFQHDRVVAILENAAVASGLCYIALVENGKTVLSTGAAPDASFWSGKAGTPEGSLLDDNIFHCWRTVRLQDCPRGFGGMGGRGGPPWRSADEPDVQLSANGQILAIGLDAATYHASVSAADRRLLLTSVLAALALGVLLAAWAFSIRNRALAAELSAVRARAATLEEMSLAAAGLAHEVKNPLGIVRGQAQRLAEDASDAVAARGAADTIMEEVDKAIARLGDFMAYAKPRRPQMQDVNVPEMLRHTLDLLRPDFSAAGVTLQERCEAIIVRADGDMLQQVLANLLLNGLQASAAQSPGKPVVVSVEHDARAHGFAKLTVSDRGRGMPPAVQKDLFKPYVSGSSDGHGLGLAVVKRIVDAHAWQIAVSSGADTGTTVTISRIVTAQPADRTA